MQYGEQSGETMEEILSDWGKEKIWRGDLITGIEFGTSLDQI
jgi:hypothetical protein